MTKQHLNSLTKCRKR